MARLEIKPTPNGEMGMDTILPTVAILATGLLGGYLLFQFPAETPTINIITKSLAFCSVTAGLVGASIRGIMGYDPDRN